MKCQMQIKAKGLSSNIQNQINLTNKNSFAYMYRIFKGKYSSSRFPSFPTRVGNCEPIPVNGWESCTCSHLSGEWNDLQIPVNGGNRLSIPVQGRESLTFSKSLNCSHSVKGIVHRFPSREGNRALIPIILGIIIHISQGNGILIPESNVNQALYPLKERILDIFPWGTGIMFFWFNYAKLCFVGQSANKIDGHLVKFHKNCASKAEIDSLC